MAQTISELEKERAELLKAIESQAQNISSNRTATPDPDGHTLKDWLNAAEDVMPSKPKPTNNNAQSNAQASNTGSSAFPSGNKASFFGVIILLSLLLTILGVLYIAYSTVNSELQEVKEVKKTSQDEAIQLQASMIKLEESVATGDSPERFVELEQRVMELELQVEMLQREQAALLAQLDKNDTTLSSTDNIILPNKKSEKVVTELILDQKLQTYTSGLEQRIDEKLSLIIDVLMNGDAKPELKEKVLLNGDSQPTNQPLSKINEPAVPEVSEPRIKQPLVKMVEVLPKPVKPVVEAPVNNYSKDVKWLLSQPEQHYILQLASMTDKQALLKMTKQKGLKDSRIVEQMRNKSVRYVLVTGSFANRNDANQLSRNIKNEYGISPWIRKMKDLTSKLP